MESEKKSGLGKGLSALFEQKNLNIDDINKTPEPKEEQTSAKKNFLEIDINLINYNPYQPREDFDEEKLNELAQSIKINGILQPITVKHSKEEGKFDLISGERRVRAAKIAGLQVVPSYIYFPKDNSAENMLELALIENVQREDLNPMELSESYQKLIDDCNLTQEQIADKLSKSRSVIANFLRLQKLPVEIKVSLRKNEITEAHARAILRLENHDEQLKLWKKLLSENLTVRKLEGITQKSQKRKKKKTYALNEFQDEYFRKIENVLTQFFGTKVKVKNISKTRGEIIIEYYSNDDLERIIEKCE
jgi:ParB family chromosome partitioning protein